RNTSGTRVCRARRYGGLPYSAPAALQYRAARRTVAQTNPLPHPRGADALPCPLARALAPFFPRAPARGRPALYHPLRRARWLDRAADVRYAGLLRVGKVCTSERVSDDKVTR